MTTDVIGDKGHWSSSLLGIRAPGGRETSIALTISVGAADQQRVERVVAVLTCPTNVLARVVVADDHLPVEVILRADGPPWRPGVAIDLAFNVVVVGTGSFAVAYRVSEQAPDGPHELAFVSGRALEDLRCRVSVTSTGMEP